ncbi:response regulator [Pedobacter sp. AW31-3R]|uniref:response regulator n=1 Tax=Pedobacter sp. AW31-3R TaxID=3445781 RepID=UPI003F9FF6B1
MNKKIVIFDDDKEILTALESVLDFVDWDLMTYASGQDALQVITKEKPDLVLMDVLMDGCDGREICRNIKEDSSLQHIPVILISGLQNTGIKNKDFGPNDFLAKPFNAGDLIDKVYFQLAS